jgi:hypothetical protein
MLVPLRLPQYSLSRSPQQLDLMAVEEWGQKSNLRAGGHGVLRSAEAERFATPMLRSLGRRFAVLRDAMCELKFKS